MKSLNSKNVGNTVFRNASSNYTVLFLNIIVIFFLTPFVIEKLGKELYGIWVIIISITTYFQLVDLGMTASLKKYISKYNASKNYNELSAVISCSFITYLILSIILLLMAFFFGKIFIPLIKIPSQLLADATKCFFVLSLDISLIIFFSFFSGILWGFQRFDLTNVNLFLTLCLRTSAYVWLLSNNYGIIELAYATLITNLVNHILKVILTVKIFPGFKIKLKYVKKNTFKYLIRFSFISFASSVCHFSERTLIPILIGFILSPIAVAYYAMASNLIQYIEELVGSIVGVLLPSLSYLNGSGRVDDAIVIANHSTKYISILTMLGVFGLIGYGKEFLGLWVGNDFAENSYLVLIIISLSAIPSFPQSASISLLFSSGNEARALIFLLIRTIISITTGIILCFYYGIVGFAIGLLIGRIIIHIFVIPNQLYLILAMSKSYFFKNTLLLPVIAGISMCTITFITKLIVNIDSYGDIIFYASISAFIYLIIIYYICIDDNEKNIIKEFIIKQCGYLKNYS